MKIVYSLYLVVSIQGGIDVAKVSQFNLSLNQCLEAKKHFVGLKENDYVICAPTVIPNKY